MLNPNRSWATVNGETYEPTRGEAPVNTLNVVSLKDACLKMEREEKEVRKLIRRYPALAPEKILGRMACTPEWMVAFTARAESIHDGICLHCGEKWDSFGEPAPETPEDG